MRSNLILRNFRPFHALLAAALFAGACSQGDSFVVVSLLSADSRTYEGVTRVKVDVTGSAAGAMASKEYRPKTALSIDASAAKTLSVGFSHNRSGSVDVGVLVFTSTDSCIGSGRGVVEIKKGGVASLTVKLTAGCPNVDGGTSDGMVTFPGCDPAAAGSCGVNQNCYVNCSTSAGECIAAGPSTAGSLCQKTTDCAQGTQCFDYSGLGCAVKSCLRFCTRDSECSIGGDGGVSGRCDVQVPCGDRLTSYKICRTPCDPRGAATAGCPAGLNCFVVGDTDNTDCNCAGPTRTKTDGQPCTTSNECAPGLFCNNMSGSNVCRKICRPDSPADCGTGFKCAMLTNHQAYGVCLPQ